MASGYSKDYVQNPAKCKFCEGSDIKVKCLHCDFFLCEQCMTGIHSKIKNSQNHKLINLKDLGSKEAAETFRKVDLENITCLHHQGQKCVSYCNSCAKSICVKCIKETCQRHTIADLEETYDNKYSSIIDLSEKISNDIPFFVNAKIQLQKSLAENGQEKDIIKDKIRKQEEIMKAEVSKLSQDLLKQVDKIYQPAEVEIQNALRKIQENEEELRKRKERLDKALHSYHACDILGDVGMKDEVLPDKVLSDIIKTQAKFFPSKLTNLRLGSIHRVPEFKLFNSYQTNLRGINSIVHIDNNMKFIGSYASQKFQQVKTENDKIDITNEENIKINDMAPMENGDIVISSFDTELKLYTKSGTLQTYKTFSPLFTLGVHVSKHNEVFVGLAECYSLTITKHSIRQVQVLNQSGDIQHTYEYDKNNQRLFTGPHRIVTCGDNICVVDILNDSGEGRMVVIDFRGHIQWVYNGCGSGTDRPKFYPCDMTVTSTDMILVSDRLNNTIHVLTPTGEVIVCHNVRDLGIEFPYSLSIDPSSGLLWVGCGTWKKDKSSTAKLHIVKLLTFEHTTPPVFKKFLRKELFS